MKRYSHRFALNIIIESDNKAEDVTEREVWEAINRATYMRLKAPEGHGLVQKVQPVLDTIDRKGEIS